MPKAGWGAGKGKYAGEVEFRTFHDRDQDTYLLEYHSRGKVIVRTCVARPEVRVSASPDNNWSGPSRAEEVDAHFFSLWVYDYFREKNGRRSYDNRNGTMEICVHAPCGYLWGEEKSLTNQCIWDARAMQVRIGNARKRPPLCALDQIAHEWAHAMSHAAIARRDKNVKDNPLAVFRDYDFITVLESIADVFALLIKSSFTGSCDWVIGKNVTAINLKNPAKGKKYNPADVQGNLKSGCQPDHMKYRYPDFTGAGIQLNTGILNKAAYLMAQGGRHRESPEIRIDRGLGLDKLEKLYYHAVENHLGRHPEHDFAIFRDVLLLSLEDLCAREPASWNRRDGEIIRKAFAAVGIGEP